jgi:hypothetical protein
MTLDEFKTLALHELANRDTEKVIEALRSGDGFIGWGASELGRLQKAREAFPTLTVPGMWKIDRELSGERASHRPATTDYEKMMLDPAWVAVDDLEYLKGLWRSSNPKRQVPLEFLTDIVVEFRDVDRSAVAARRNKTKAKRASEN